MGRSKGEKRGWQTVWMSIFVFFALTLSFLSTKARALHFNVSSLSSNFFFAFVRSIIVIIPCSFRVVFVFFFSHLLSATLSFLLADLALSLTTALA